MGKKHQWELEIPIYVPKTKKTFKSHKGAQTHCNRNYDTVEDAYLDITGDTKPVCTYCNTRTLKYASFTKGYMGSCMVDECKRKHSSFINQQIADALAKKYENGIEGFDEYLILNYDSYYETFHNKDLKQYYEPFEDKTYNSLSKYRAIIKRNSESKLSIFDKKCKCLHTGVEYSVNVLTHGRVDNPRIYLFNTVDYSSRNFLKEDEFPQIFIDFWIEYIEVVQKNSDVDNLRLFKRKKFKYSDIIRPMLSDELDHLYSLYKRYLEESIYIYDDRIVTRIPRGQYKGRVVYELFNQDNEYLVEKFKDEIVRDCVVCNEAYIGCKSYVEIMEDGSEKVFHVDDKGLYTCSQQCYFTLLKNNKDLYYVYNNDTKISQSILMKNKILCGSFTPCVTNSRCYSRVYSKDINRFPMRSTWEAVYYAIQCIEGRGNSLLYEHIRIEYYINTERHIYIVDFIDVENGILYEIKPDSERDDITKTKEEYTREYCKRHNLVFEYIGNTWFYDNYNRYHIDDILKYIDIDKDILQRRMKQFTLK